jgi:hypothetical protein
MAGRQAAGAARSWAAGLGGVRGRGGMAAACVVLLLAGHVSVSDAVNAYLVTNLGMVVTFAAIVLRPVAGSPRSGAGAHPGV